jgi:hypothetical protein
LARQPAKRPENAGGLEDPDRCQREAQALERLLLGLTVGQVFISDEEAEAFLRAALESHDKKNGYKEVVAAHDAMNGLLVLLEGEGER